MRNLDRLSDAESELSVITAQVARAMKILEEASMCDEYNDCILMGEVRRAIRALTEEVDL